MMSQDLAPPDLTPQEKEALVRRSFASYLSVDRAEIEAILHKDFTFTSPYDDHIDRAAYFERCWPNAGLFVRLDLHDVKDAGEGCFALYEGRSKRGSSFRNVEYFRFRDGLICEVEVFFGLEPGGKPTQPRS